MANPAVNHHTLSGCRGYQALEDFWVRHSRALSEKLGLTVNRLPSDTTAASYTDSFPVVSRAVSAMGSTLISSQASGYQLIRASKELSGSADSYQNFVSVVSVYSNLG